MPQRTVLIIENDLDTTEKIAETMEAEGYSVFKAYNAEVGLNLAKKVIPSLIFLNLSTPGTNGLGICKTLREIDTLKDVPIVLLTLREGKFDDMYRTLFGIAGFLKKPFTEETLIYMVEDILPKGPSEKEQPLAEEEEEERLVETGTLEEEEIAEEAPVRMAEEEIGEAPAEEPEPKMAEAEEFLTPPEGIEEPEREEPLLEGIEEAAPEPRDEMEKVGEAPAEVPEAEETAREALKEEEVAVGPAVPLSKPPSPWKAILSVASAAAVVLFGFVVYSVFFQNTTEEAPAPPQRTIPSQPKPVEVGPQEGPESPEPGLVPEIAVGEPDVMPPPPVAPPASEPLPGVTETEKRYYVQFGFFRMPDNARNFADKLAADGLDVFIHVGTSRDRKTVYRVLLKDGFDSASTARQEAKRVSGEKNLDTAVFFMGP